PKALGRILSRINFGSTLNIAASLANPVLPSIGVRGVYATEMIQPVARVMKQIGYQSAVVLHGTMEGSKKGMDEASVCGITHGVRIFENDMAVFEIDSKKLGLWARNCHDLVPEGDVAIESKRFVALIRNRENGARKNAVLLNAGLIFWIAGKAADLVDGIEQATVSLESGAAFNTLEKWVRAQNTDPEKGLERLYRLVR
ncbi:MAG: anthranilate phosphoribosyltransferase, partial [Desulfatitalea sp.]|nr:anthranilate phosphoribosyltransferase [Desulfatitalea sp.]NNJ99169.1 anthranilate phosphoribosyltransferase [Desulfatitalea sp.]